jgi:hypothetical protein
VHHPPTIDPATTSPTRPERCSSVLGRWRCGLPRGHEGLHAAHDDHARTTWNDNASGRRLGDL